MFLVATALAAVGVVGVAGTASAAIGTDDYPSYLKTAAPDSLTDPWGFYNRECVSFVADRLNNDNNMAFSNNMSVNGVAGHYGYAYQWKDNAIKLYGASVFNGTPAAGSVAWWGVSSYASLGHVAYVDSVNGDGSINIEQYNAWPDEYAYSAVTIHPGDYNWPSGFLHLKDLTSGGGTTVTDSDKDGVPNSTDRCPNFAGAPSNRGCRFDGYTVSGNFVGNDGYTDSLTFYDYTGGNLGAFVSQGSANGLSQPQLLWTTGSGQWTWGASSFYAGNFAGNDNYTDVIGLYDYGNGQLGAFLFQGNGSGVGPAQHLWTTSANTWARGRARYVIGNFAGNDGKDDILAFYSYGDDSTGVFVLAGNGSGVGQPTHEWSTGANQWNAQNAEYMAGDFAGNDGYTDVVAFYQYAGNSLGAFLYQGSANGLGQAQLLWTTPQQTWNVAAGRYFVGDFAGGDNIPDVLALYNLGGGNTGSYVFQGNGSGVDQVQSLWTTGANQWSMPNTKAVAGMFGGSHTSVFAWYNYGSTTGGALFPTASPTDGVALPTIKWTTAAGQWSWPAM
jgi:surface antigen